MKVLMLIIFLVVMYVSVFLRVTSLHPFSTLYYTFRDSILYILYKRKNILVCGHLDCYCADFGGGKTLSMSHYIYKLFKRYDNKRFYDPQCKCWIQQRLVVLSNFVVFGVRSVHLSTLQDVVAFSQKQKDYDSEHGTRTCLLVAIDEASCQLNSRNFKSNIDPLFLNTLITCRHYNINFIYSSQSFFLTDKLLRDVTQRVIHCKKVWRVMLLNYYNAHVVENAGNIETLKPIVRRGWFIRDVDFSRYDTLSCVDNLTKDDSFLSYDEILSNLGGASGDSESLDTYRKRRFRRKK